MVSFSDAVVDPMLGNIANVVVLRMVVEPVSPTSSGRADIYI